MSLDEMSTDADRMMWKINAEAPLMLIHHAAPHLRFGGNNQPGAIINLVDNASGRGDWPHLSHYCASKAALLSVTRSLSQELAPTIRVNAVGPGAILFQDWESEEKRSSILSSIPMGRQGLAEEIAETVLFWLRVLTSLLDKLSTSMAAGLCRSVQVPSPAQGVRRGTRAGQRGRT